MPAETLEEEHARLLRETEALRRDHAALHSDPSDLIGHREHRVRLQRQIDALHDHIHRIKREAPQSSDK
jgi:predicted RNase H-like nuclease (RuvC/YqgF family)